MSGENASRSSSKWWQRAVIYQIAPMSLQDSNGDGKGDLQGIIDRIPYLEWLGIDAVWLCPIFPLPMLDFGYDISDYCNVDPLFGSLAVFDDLIARLHARGIKLLLDLVPNHTSSRLYRTLLNLRKSEAALVRGEYRPMRARNEVLMYKRATEREELFIALNFSPQSRKVEFDGAAKLLISSRLDRDSQAVSKQLILRGDEESF